jgi:hypothetical protein
MPRWLTALTLTTGLAVPFVAPAPGPMVHAQDAPPIRIDVAPAPVVATNPTRDFQGQGQQRTSAFPLTAGVVVAELTYNGARLFSATLLEATTGQRIGLLGTAIGATHQSKALRVGTRGDYALNVEGDGTWAIRLWQPVPVAETDATRFSGTGAVATPVFPLTAGLRRFTLTHSGARVFAVQLLQVDGTTTSLLVSEIGAFEGATVVQVRQNGLFVLSVEADGPWTVAVE